MSQAVRVFFSVPEWEARPTQKACVSSKSELVNQMSLFHPCSQIYEVPLLRSTVLGTGDPEKNMT